MPAPLVCIALAMAAAPVLLRPGSELSQDVSPGHPRSFAVVLAAGEHAEVSVRGRDLRVDLLDPRGQRRRRLQTSDRACADGPGSRLDLVGERAGTWRIEIASPETRDAVITFQHARPATDTDRLAFAAGELAGRAAEAASSSGAAARDLASCALAAAEQAFASDPLALAAFLEDLSTAIAGPAADFAERMLAEAAALRADLLGDADPCVADSHSALVASAYAEGRFADAERHALEAVSVLRQVGGGVEVQLARALRDLGVATYQQGRLAESAGWLGSSLEASERLEPPDGREVARSLYSLGEAERARGRYERATDLLERALAIAERAFPPDDPDLARVVNTLAGLHRDLAHFDEAERLVKRSLEIRKRSGATGDLLATGYLNLAEVYRMQGRYAEAEPLYLQALAIARPALGPGNPELAWYVNQAAKLYHETGRLAEARALYLEALPLVEQSLGPSHPLLAQGLHDLGSVLLARGQAAEAERQFQRALGIREEVYGPDHPESAVALVDVVSARLHGSSPDLEEATALLDRAVALLDRTVASPESTVDALRLRGGVHERRGDRASAIADLARALDRVEALRPRRGGGDVSRAGFLARYRADTDLLIGWRLEAGELALAFDEVERSRARTLLDRLDASGVDLTSGIPEAVLRPMREREQAARARGAEAEGRLAFTRARADLDQASRARLVAGLERDLEAAARDQQQAWDDVRNASPLGRELGGRRGRHLRAEAVQAGLVPNSGLVLAYRIGPGRSWLFVLPERPAPLEVFDLVLPDGAPSGLEPGTALTAPVLERLVLGDGEIGSVADRLEVERALKPLRRPGADAASTGALAARLHYLWRLLVPPELRPRLAAADEVVVVTDGALAYVPFEALVLEPKDNPIDTCYWLDEGPVVRYAPSASLLGSLAARERAARSGEPGTSALSVADPAYARGYGLERLPGTLEETRALIAAFPAGSVEVLAGPRATEGAVRAALPGRRYLHFATHGVVEERTSDLLAALALTPPAGQPTSSDDDGFLRLVEIYQLDLDCDLAVLSACRTSRGRTVEGEGVFALSRGFLAAGSRRVVASLWSVSDRSTASLMGGFFRRIGPAAGAGPVDHARALRDAKRAVRAEPRWASPYHWAPFLLSGLR